MQKIKETAPTFDSIDARNETRLLFACNELPAIRQQIQEMGFEQLRYSDKPVTQTIYLSTSISAEHKLIYTRLRRYKKKISDRDLDIARHEESLLEIKLDGQSKERLKTTADRIIKADFSMVGSQALPEAYVAALRAIDSFRPSIATEWLREHYMIGESGVRLTLDTVMAYFKFDNNGGWKGKKVGISEHVRLECKEAVDGNLGSELNRILGGMIAPQDWHKIEIERLSGRS